MMGTVVAGGICQLPRLLRGAGTAATAGGSSPFVSCCQMFLCKIIRWKNREGRTFFQQRLALIFFFFFWKKKQENGNNVGGRKAVAKFDLSRAQTGSVMLG